jgi:hypothetical protein
VRPFEFVVAEDTFERKREEPTLLFDRKLPRWVERIARAGMRWLGVHAERQVRHRRFVRPAALDLLERMHLNRGDMLRLYNGEARYVFVGPETFDDMLRSAHMMGLGSLDGAPIGGPNGVRIIMGVEVVLVPWMEGALLVPEWRRDR